MARTFSLLFISKQEVRRLFAFNCPRNLSGNGIMRILNVAEKNDAAKNIASHLSGGTAYTRNGPSMFNKIYEFECQVFGQNAKMIMTSVRGHLLNYSFVGQHKNWKSTDPILLFEMPVYKVLIPDNSNIKQTLENEIKSCSKLIIWTDCDREGENIGFEIIEVCKAIRRNIEVYRAIFSEITSQSVKKALRKLEAPRVNISNAVDVRSELDLRIGAAFTRLQTVYLQKAFPNALDSNVISYGTCQFPTLGFIVERFKAISEFKPETFWQIGVEHEVNKLMVDFTWQRHRLFDQLACEVLFEKCAESGIAKVENIENRPRTKWRPRPLETTTLQKLCSRRYRMTGKETLRIAENLYTRGLISYPRTETNVFAKEIDLSSLVALQTSDSQWGEFAQRVLREGPDPFQGCKSDHAHPPIHPIKHSTELTGDEQKVYELIVRHFLACLSKHAEGLETTVDIDIAGEKFSAKGLMITARNYLEVYPYEKWNESEIHSYRKGEVFKPEISMKAGETSPPELLTEADLISLMEKHGIGTDATHAEHIEKVKARLYVGLQNDMYFVPRTLGMGLVEGYNNMGYPMAKPKMRAELEADLKRICEGQRSPDEVLATHIEKHKKLFEGVQKQLSQLSKAIQNYIQVEAAPVESELFEKKTWATMGKCTSCNSDLILKRKKDGSMYIGCSGFPVCRVALWLPSFVLDVSRTTISCPTCGPDKYLLGFKFRARSCRLAPDHIGCIGCDWDLLEVLHSNDSFRNGKTDWTKNATTQADPQDAGDEVLSSLSENSSARRLSDGSIPKCHCGLSAVCFVVKKSGPNLGREFYMCPIKSSSKCDFFQWKTSSQQIGEKSTNLNESRPSEGRKKDIRCYCSIPCRRNITSKEGPNKGRHFFACGKSFQDSKKCNFFKWADGDDLGGFDGDRLNRMAETIYRRTADGSESANRSGLGGSVQMSKKRCTICGEGGHDGSECPWG